MMRSLLIHLLFLLACSTSLLAQPARLSSLDSYIDEAMQHWDLPGLAIGIIHNDQIVYQKGFGVKKLGDPSPVDTETLFAIGSNTKAFTATGLGLLQAEGKLHWDDRVIDHLSPFVLYDPYTTREIRIRDLLCHRSGYGLWAGDLVFWGSNYSRDEIIERMRYLKPSFGFRSRYAYSNQMFILAGAVLEAAAGMSWEDFMVTRLFNPLEMQHTLPGASTINTIENVASPHSVIQDTLVSIAHRPIDNAAPAGAIYSNVQDMLKWLQFQLNDGIHEGEELLPASILRETHTPQVYRGGYPISENPNARSHFRAYGLGWGIHDYADHIVISHTGGVDGFFSHSGIVPEENLGIVILTNDDQNGLYRALFDYILDIYLDQSEVDWSQLSIENRVARVLVSENPRILDTQPSLARETYAGKYVNQHYGEAEVTYHPETGLQIHLKAHDGLQGPMTHWHFDTFEATWVDPYWKTSLVHFDLDEEGKPSSFSIKVREDFIDTLSYTFEREGNSSTIQ